MQVNNSSRGGILPILLLLIGIIFIASIIIFSVVSCKQQPARPVPTPIGTMPVVSPAPVSTPVPTRTIPPLPTPPGGPTVIGVNPNLPNTGLGGCSLINAHCR